MELRAALKQYFGFDSFRPLQEGIILDALAGRDVFALLPTGGGKSLCFQLPALLRNGESMSNGSGSGDGRNGGGVTLVVSPLISLMKDQVDALQASGVRATFLNSTLDSDDARARLRGLYQGEYRLLYAAPERVMMSGFLENAKRWGVNLIAVDEAHCISEWGHDFRPEYRQLAGLRDHFPEAPIMALTATATERVRADIVHHLRLRDPRCYVASFNRPNLLYRVLPKSRPYEQVRELVGARPRESGIVYCHSRKAAESLAQRLSRDGILARPYHAGLSGEERARNQELFLRDEVRVICATIAFGMGINKPNVRFVIHHDLPKNIEGYYQETGRAGRDGLPSECVLLFSASDVAKLIGFIDEKTDEEERRIAREQLQGMVHYAESARCRRAELLRYFGEEYPEPQCGGCDNCLTPRETFDGTVLAQKLLSCAYRVQEKSGFPFGLNHVIEVLVGADTETVRKWRHHEVSAYGIGTELDRAGWRAVGRELIRLGLLQQSSGKFLTVALTREGLEVLKRRKPILLTRQPEPAPEERSSSSSSSSSSRDRARARERGEIPCDETLFERLRTLRRKVADERNVPAYIVFSDVSLREMARRYPTTPEEFGRVPGVGQQKLEDFGEQFTAEIRDFLASNPRLENLAEAPVSRYRSRRTG